MKIVINRCFGGFGLSPKAVKEYLRRSGNTNPDFYYGDIERNDPILVAVVEELGEAADTRYSRLHIVEIPDDVEWIVEEYDGSEWIAEKHHTWS